MTFEISDDVARHDRDWIWQMPSTQAYWVRWRQGRSVRAVTGTTSTPIGWG